MSYIPQPMTAAKINMSMLRQMDPTIQEIPTDDPVFKEYWVQLEDDPFTLAPETEFLDVFIFTGDKDPVGFAPIEYRP